MYVMHNPIFWHDPTGLLAEPNNVILRYIIEKNGGSVVNTLYNRDGSIRSMTVNMGGVTRGYAVGQSLSIVGGQAVIDHRTLMNHFGLTQTQATHQSGDLFTTSTDAALAFYLTYFDNSRDHWYERGAFIYRVWTGPLARGNTNVGTGFTFGRVFEGTHDHVIGGMVRNWFSNPGGLNSDISMASKIGMIHTHPSCDCHNFNANNNFSGPDLRFGDISGLIMYLATPERGLLRREPRRDTIQLW